MKAALLVFPHQLFTDHPGFRCEPDLVVLTEDPLFFGDSQYRVVFHQQKLVLHRASMRYYQALVQKRGQKVQYFSHPDKKSELNKIFDQLKSDDFQLVTLCEVTDSTLEKRLKAEAKRTGLRLKWLPSPGWLNTREENQAYRADKKRWFMADFYQYQRRRLGVLMAVDKPQGGQWSFDEANRKKLPKNKVDEIPPLEFPTENQWVKEAKNYVKQHWPDNLGLIETFYYPTTHAEAETWLEQFLSQRLSNFGPYEDAIEEGQNWLYHSVLTPMLNIGLLTPQQVLDQTLEYAAQHEVPIASLEGFMRQIIGWREFMRVTYQDLGVKMRTTNHWQHTRTIPASFYDGSTGIDPVDDTIKRVLKTGYCHHIERLMVLGGFMFLCEFNPDEVYTWFMELFIDSYDWVMVPNVYAMSQNADGGLITTKPYFSGSNYICKMSHYSKGEWTEIWDGLYWRWILKHADSLRKNPRWAMMVQMAEKMETEKKQKHLSKAEAYLGTLGA